MDYNDYKLSKSELLIAVCKGIMLCGVVSYLFYNSVLIFLVLSPGIIFFVKKEKAKLAKEQKKQLNEQFKDGILSLSSSLQAGYSIENGFEQTLTELRKIYDRNQPIIKEFKKIVVQLRLNVTVEDLLLDLADRSQVEDIVSFAEVLSIAKRTGGDLIKIIQDSSRNLSEKIETQEEAYLSIAGKQLEHKVMSLVPFGIIVYIRISSPGFLSILYGNVLGGIVMTGCLTGYIIAYFLGKKIVNIQV